MDVEVLRLGTDALGAAGLWGTAAFPRKSNSPPPVPKGLGGGAVCDWNKGEDSRPALSVWQASRLASVFSFCRRAN